MKAFLTSDYHDSAMPYQSVTADSSLCRYDQSSVSGTYIHSCASVHLYSCVCMVLLLANPRIETHTGHWLLHEWRDVERRLSLAEKGGVFCLIQKYSDYCRLYRHRFISCSFILKLVLIAIMSWKKISISSLKWDRIDVYIAEIIISPI